MERQRIELQPGLVSVSFRALSPGQIVELARQCQLTAIEWGGDVHVPPGDLARAREVRAATVDAGLRTVAYGSYLRLGEDAVAEQFDSTIETAIELHAPAIRVWAGRRGSAQSDAAYRAGVAEDALKLAAKARAASPELLICYEYHADTLTDTDASAAALFAATDHPNIRTLWQPPHELSVEQRCQSLRRVMGDLQHVHVFHWPKRGERAPLAAGRDDWRRYFAILAAEFPAPVCPALLEFVRDDDPEQLRADAATLKELLTVEC
jgi:sugar phosphate isomerase/epimerase